MRNARSSTLSPADAREVAVRVLLAGGGQASLDLALRDHEFTNRDRALLVQLVYGTLKRKRSLDWSLSRIVKRPLAELDPALLWVLRLGAYQLLYLERVPVHGAVNESVKVARRLGHSGTAGLANAVLRKLALSRLRPPRPDVDDRIVVLANYVSLPDWLAQHFVQRFGFELALKIGDGINAPARRAARVNMRVTTFDEMSETLGRAGITVTRSRYGIANCLVLTHVPTASAPALQRMIRSGRVTMQSEESQLAVALLDPKPGEIVIDVCAGRGVKTGAIAARGPQKVYALDDDADKLALLQNEMVRLGEENVETAVLDATQPHDIGPPEGADAVLVDAPCSGIGTIGRRADLRWVKDANDPARLAATQLKILDRAAQHVHPEGRLLYVTCSTDAREDEGVIKQFLQRHPDWSEAAFSESVHQAFTSAPPNTLLRLGESVLIIPGIDGADGFYFALLRRKAKQASNGAPV